MTAANLAVPDNDTVIQYTSTGEATFAYDFPILAAAELKASIDGVLKTFGSDYTISGIGDAGGGTVTFTPATTIGERITIYQDMDIDRATGFSDGTAVIAATALNSELARTTRVDQQLRRDIKRALRIPIDDSVSGVNMELGNAAARAGKYLRFNDTTGAPELADVTGSGTVLSQSIIADLLNPDTANEGGTTPDQRWFWERDIERYGADPLGIGDSRAALAEADTVGAVIYIRNGGTFRIGSSITVTNPIHIEAGAMLSMDGGATLTANGGIIADGLTQKFSGAGNVVIGVPQDVFVDWWDRTATDCITKCWAAKAQGSTVWARGKYTLGSTWVWSSDEANQTGDIGCEFRAIGGRGTRLRDKVSGDWGCEIYLADGVDADMVQVTGTDQGGGVTSSRFSGGIYGVKFNGNAANNAAGSGIVLSFVKDFDLNVYVEDCVGKGIEDTNSNNQIRLINCEALFNGDDGFNFGATADSQIQNCKAGANTGMGMSIAAGHWHFDNVHCYLNGERGFNYTGDDACHANHIRCNQNGEVGARFNNCKYISVDGLECFNNGTNAAAGATERANLKITGTSEHVHIRSFHAHRDVADSSQYHLYCDATGEGIRIEAPMDLDDQALVQDVLVSSAARGAISFGKPGTRTLSTTTGSIELEPQLGDLRLDTALTGAVDFDYTQNNKIPDGHVQKVTIVNGGGQNVTAGTNVTPLAGVTMPTPATTAKTTWLTIEYVTGQAYVTDVRVTP